MKTTVIVKKMSKMGLLKLHIVLGTLIMVAAVIGLPAGIIVTDVTLLSYPIVWGVMLAGILFFVFAAFIGFIRPYILYRKTPDVLAESDGQFLYVHAKKEAKIPLADLSDATVHVWLPFLFHEGFLAEFIVHLFSERYGDVALDVPGYGTYRMRFVGDVHNSAQRLADFIAESV